MIRFVAFCVLCFFQSFSLSLLHVVVGRGSVYELWHFFPDHTRIFFCILDKAPIMVSKAVVSSSRQIDMCRERLGLFVETNIQKKTSYYHNHVSTPTYGLKRGIHTNMTNIVQTGTNRHTGYPYRLFQSYYNHNLPMPKSLHRGNP